MIDDQKNIVGNDKPHFSEVALPHSEKLFELLIESATDYAIFTMDKNRLILTWNKGAERILGYTEEEIIGRTVDVIFTPEDRAAGAPEKKAETALSEGQAGDNRWHIRKDGSLFYASGVMTSLGEGETKYLAKILRDRTQQKRMEDSLRENEERLRRALEIETIGVIFFNAKGKLTNANNAFLQMSGYSREYLTSGKLNWSDLTPPEWMEPSRRAVEELKAEGHTTPYEKEYFRKDGSRFWGLFAAKQLSEDESIEYVLDVTEKKRAEEKANEANERFEVVARVTNDAIWDWDLQTNQLSWSNGVQTLFGYSLDPTTEHVDWWFERIHDDDGERIRKDIYGVIDSGNQMWSAEYRFRRDDGSFAEVSDRGYLIYGENGKPVRMIGGMTDITEQKVMEEKLRRSHDELEDRVRERTNALMQTTLTLAEEVEERKVAEQQIRELLRKLVNIQENERCRIAREIHDQLGQEMTGLRLKLSSLKSKHPEQEAELAEQIEEAEQMAEQIDSSIDFLAWEMRPAALDELGLKAAFGNFVRNWSKHFGIKAEFQSTVKKNQGFSEEIENNLYRILQEALQNVKKHAGADSVSVVLTQHDDQLELIIEDNGRGYDEEKEISSATNKGMGMINIRERAALFGGTLLMESAPNKGTTIFVRIPAQLYSQET